MKREELLGKLKEFKDCAVIILMKKGLFTKEDEEAYKEIAAIIKNQPTITKRGIENCAGAIQYSVQTHEDWGYVEDIIKEMLDDIGVSIKDGKDKQ